MNKNQIEHLSKRLHGLVEQKLEAEFGSRPPDVPGDVADSIASFDPCLNTKRLIRLNRERQYNVTEQLATASPALKRHLKKVDTAQAEWDRRTAARREALNKAKSAAIDSAIFEGSYAAEILAAFQKA